MVGPLGAKRTARLRILLRNAYGDFCHWCGKRMIFEPAFHHHQLYASVEHLVERRDGGTHDWENLRLAHRKCNTDRSNKPPDPNSRRSRYRQQWLEKVPGERTQSRRGRRIDEAG